MSEPTTAATDRPGQSLHAMFLLALIVLCGTAFWGFWSLQDRYDSAALATRDAEEMVRSAEHILQLRGSNGSTSVETPWKPDELRSLIGSAAESAEIKVNDIVEQPTRKLQGVSLQEQPTQVTFRDVSLQQLVRFLHDVSGPKSGLSVTQIRLAGSRDASRGEEWSAEATVSHFSPAEEPKPPAARPGAVP